jgi:4-diphosphocytidyl-2-C-methyl-D-erythritol kinase
MISFPNCKINLGLNITRKRGDGYHDLETIFYPLKLKDALEGIISGVGHSAEPEIQFSSSGLLIKGDAKNNLCVKAYDLLKKDFPSLPGMQVHVHKVIPMGAGLGGGSADGAFALQLINQLCGLHLSWEQLTHYALQLGSDCPFFLLNKPCFASGRGEIMKEINLDLSMYRFVIVNPGIHISTAEAFSKITPAKPKRPIPDIIQLPVSQWKGLLVNDFEKSIHAHHPEIELIKQELYNHGAEYASMTGSGSSVFGIFNKDAADTFSFDPRWNVYHL